jgi:glyoxylase-like metal-dependent hydrolase (beta-lactamase superfamily II)
MIELRITKNFTTALTYFQTIIIVLFAFTLSAQPSPTHQLAPNVYFYAGDELQQKSANCLWVIFKDYVLAIDANYPWGAQEILEEIKKTTDKPVRFIFNTHYHHDHTFGNSVFVDAGAIVVASQVASDEMHTLGQIEWNRGTSYSGRDMKKFRREYPTLTFDQRMVFDDGEEKVILIKTGPGHTAGDAVAYLPKEKILATGDLCVNGNPWGNNVADQDVAYDDWLRALDTMSTWEVTTVIPGHGNPGNTQTLIDQRAYLADMLAQVREGLKRGKSKEELVNEIDLSKHPVRGMNKISNERSIRAMFDRLSH